MYTQAVWKASHTGRPGLGWRSMNAPQVLRNAVVAKHGILPLVIIAKDIQIVSALFAVDYDLYLLPYILAFLRHLLFVRLSLSPCVSFSR